MRSPTLPLCDGHALVVPRRHVERLEDLDAHEWAGVFALVHQIAPTVRAERSADAVNVGVNSGKAAGQTIEHAHVHVIPRHDGDVVDPRGAFAGCCPSARTTRAQDDGRDGAGRETFGPA